MGIVFFVAGLMIGAALLWMVQRRRGRSLCSKRTGRAWRVIAVPIVNGCMPRSALSVAAGLGVAAHGTVVVLVVVQIPRTVGIDVQSPPELESALSRLDAAEGIVRALGASVRGELVRVREVGDLVGRACKESGAEAVILEPHTGSRATAELTHALLEGKDARSFDLVLAYARKEDRSQ